MALGATIYTIDVDLADADRGVYESLNLRVAQHPSETPDYLMTQVIAYCLEFAEGISFSKGLSDPDEPAICVRDLTGVLQVWVDIGLPEPERLHRASKAAPRVAVYTHKDPMRLLRLLEGERVHRRDALEIYAVDRDFLATWVARLTRRMKFDLSISDGQIYLVLDEAALTGIVTPQTGSGREA